VIEPLFVIAEYGHGKRAGVLSDYTFAVKDDDNNSVSKLRTIGKEGFAIFSTRYPLFMKERHSAGTRPAGPGTGWSKGWAWGPGSLGPAKKSPVR